MARRKTALATEEAAPAPQESGPIDTATLPEAVPMEPEATNGVLPPQNGNGQKPRPVFKVGPLACDKNTSVECAVWANEVTLSDQRTFTVHNVTLHGSWRDADGTWKPLKSFRGSHLHVLVYCLQRASDWILAQRDPHQNCPF